MDAGWIRWASWRSRRARSAASAPLSSSPLLSLSGSLENSSTHWPDWLMPDQRPPWIPDIHSPLTTNSSTGPGQHGRVLKGPESKPRLSRRQPELPPATLRQPP
ncbi:hypothetical protein M430DRAFT_177543 [Amorphotheca resinae ATCC 22711]|uniref:Uncharacterized protein n=1 Tax=Amorphotheca resinae ATCC 22711 TaxID=857342 RepID=A0A2T3AT76_AMORE|nr:hypothetical protein M430DRAFT_177543 [Amorphotheca resinae ATCC 22711]PSS10662.1 hypothetical protein M430DRAFT_177543 [Amorphotheca resinae ATCC 22711]